ncbi:MAG: double-strand break repair protein AddB, partial [Alphaproteobacteria bacterium]
MPKNILNIPPAYSFIDVLAQYLLEHVGGELSRTTVILSNRRGCRSLRDALLRHSAQGALLLPRMLPLGDLDPDELILTEPEIDQADVIAPLTRQAILMRLLRQHYGAQVGTAPGLQARLART